MPFLLSLLSLSFSLFLPHGPETHVLFVFTVLLFFLIVLLYFLKNNFLNYSSMLLYLILLFIYLICFCVLFYLLQRLKSNSFNMYLLVKDVNFSENQFDVIISLHYHSFLNSL